MKKIISLLLVLALTLGCVFVIASCGGENTDTPNTPGTDTPGTDTPGTDEPGTDEPGTDEPGTDTPGTDEPGADEPAAPSLYDLVESNAPTQITTQVDYVDAEGTAYTSFYITQIEGSNSIFKYTIQRPATLDEALEGADEIVTVGPKTVYYKDGLYSENGTDWEAKAPTIDYSSKFDLKEEYLTEPTLNETGTVLEAKVSAENAEKIFGSSFDADGDIELTVETNGVYLSSVSVFYVTKTGAEVTINTSYTNKPITLEFPVIAE